MSSAVNTFRYSVRYASSLSKPKHVKLLTPAVSLIKYF